ncbi:MAG: hypothetical protein DI539_15055 [Flavobacterium psychrophilum]|nr:MAG: hypothetical protein DI539_15055 [Flavobacterium psychrophilum]
MPKIDISEAYVQTISWADDKIIDWSTGGRIFLLDGKRDDLELYHYRYKCDAAITSKDGTYSLIYAKLGTKALLLKNGNILREVNRSYYRSDVYEYPAAFFTTTEGKTYLIHCPIAYNRIDFEDVETGEIVTNESRNDLSDIFHSRFEISPDNKFLLSKGWIWSPIDTICVFDIEACLKTPSLLNHATITPDWTGEICSASFADNEYIVLCTSNEEPLDDDEPVPAGHIALWNFKTGKFSKAVKPPVTIGNLFAVNIKYCWDLYEYPKLINIETGEIEQAYTDIDSGKQASSIIWHLKNLPLVAHNIEIGKLAISNGKDIVVLSID